MFDSCHNIKQIDFHLNVVFRISARKPPFKFFSLVVSDLDFDVQFLFYFMTVFNLTLYPA